MAVTPELLASFDPEFIERMKFRKEQKEAFDLYCYTSGKDFIKAVDRWYANSEEYDY